MMDMGPTTPNVDERVHNQVLPQWMMCDNHAVPRTRHQMLMPILYYNSLGISRHRPWRYGIVIATKQQNYRYRRYCVLDDDKVTNLTTCDYYRFIFRTGTNHSVIISIDVPITIATSSSSISSSIHTEYTTGMI